MVKEQETNKRLRDFSLGKQKPSKLKINNYTFCGQFDFAVSLNKRTNYVICRKYLPNKAHFWNNLFIGAHLLFCVNSEILVVQKGLFELWNSFYIIIILLVHIIIWKLWAIPSTRQSLERRAALPELSCSMGILVFLSI